MEARNLNINTLSENYKRLEEEITKLYQGIHPLFAIVDDLANAMEGSGKDYFILPAQVSKDSQRHYFHFTTEWNSFERQYMYEFSHVDNFIK